MFLFFSDQSANDLLVYCGKHFGNPKSLHYHTNVNSEAFNNFFIVEFESSDIVDEIIVNHARHRDDSSDHFPVCSPFLWLSQEQLKNQGRALLSFRKIGAIFVSIRICFIRDFFLKVPFFYIEKMKNVLS